MKVVSLLRPEPTYRADAFLKGAKALGYQPAGQLERPSPGDLLITWNRYGGADKTAQRFLKAGAKVLVAENCYLGNDFLGDRFYAISRDHHNGGGFWVEDNGERWASFGYELAPYKKYDREGQVLILPQRGIGPPGVAMPTPWLNQMRQKHLPRAHVRTHPGRRVGPGMPALEEDLKRAKCMVTWGSGAAIKGLAAGVPCISTWDKWIGAPAATPLEKMKNWDVPIPTPDRLPMFERLAGAIWRLSEIESGEAMEKLLEL